MKKKILAIFLSATLSFLPVASVQASDVELLDVDSVLTDNADASEQEVSEELHTADYKNSYAYIDKEVEYYVPVDDVASVYATEIPASYDSRDYGYITECKDQNPYGACWAFAAIGVAESTMLAQGYETDYTAIDYSEHHLAYFFYNDVDDPLGNTGNDSTYPVGDNYLDVGGNNFLTIFAFASWKGAADESVAPYSAVLPENLAGGDLSDAALSDDLAFKDVAHMQNAYVVPIENASHVKKFIMNYGAVATSIYFYDYAYNYDTNAMYQDVSSYPNHGVMIVGWDDNYAVSNFESGYTPDNPGAWLIKNSWGPDASEAYFWVSYEDLCLANEDAFVYIFESADNYDKNYQYDGGTGLTTAYMYNGESISNVYTCNGEYAEQIKAVSIALSSDNIKYSIQIYRNPSTDDPTSGSQMLSQPQTGTTTYHGYHTIELDEEIYVNPGDKFAVTFTLESANPGDSYFYVYLDGDCDYGWVKMDSQIEPNQSYIISDYYGIEDLYDESAGEGDFCARIKAFTDITYKKEIEVNDYTPAEPETPVEPETPTEPDSEPETPAEPEESYDSGMWFEFYGDWYYITADGYFAVGWWLIDGTWYYFDQYCVMQTGWEYLGGVWYYFTGSGAMVTGWQYIDGVWYYFNASGAMATGWLQSGETWYYLNTSGAMVTGWQEISGSWYYFDANGAMAESTWIGSYYVGASGAWIVKVYTEGWKLSGGLWWYQNADGTYPASMWKSIGNAWYYFDAAGWMKTGWVHDGYGWYYMEPSGAMKTGWLLYNGNWYYLNESGTMVTNTVVDGCIINGDGIWVW